MSFGFGIGDIVTCSQMAWKTIDALRTAGSEFEGLRLELSSLTSVISGLEAEARGPMPLINTASPERQQEMRSLLRNCTASMDDLQNLVRKYKGMNSSTKRDFVAWMRFAAKDKRSPREKLAVHTASINIFLTTLSHSSLARLEFLIKNGPQKETPTSGSVNLRGLGQTGRINTKTDVGPIWQQIGSSLAKEGISQQDVERFQEEVKAYVRYLVRGETPFWAASRSTLAREAEAEAEARMREEVHRKSSGRIIEVEPGKHPRIIRYQESKSEDTRKAKSEGARKLDEIRRERLRNEVRAAHGFQGIANDMSIEEMGRRREKETNVVDLEEVVGLADLFESLFEHQRPPDRVQHVEPQLEVKLQEPLRTQEDEQDPAYVERNATTKSRRELDQQRLREEAERLRDTRVHEIRRKIEALRRKYYRYQDDKRWAEAQDLEDHAIPLQIEALEREGVHVLPSKAWQGGFVCDLCQFWIPGARYHCQTCQGSSGRHLEEGNWDVCEECWDTRLKCPGGDAHKMVLLQD